MSTAQVREFVSPDDYLRSELVAKTRHEYVAGTVYAMVGETNAHNLIASNALGALHGQLRGKPCRALNSDTKIRIRLNEQTRFYYPDVSVVCHLNAAADTFHDQPVLVVEVLSKSTRRTDEEEKRHFYLSISSLSVFILLESEFPMAVVYRRFSNGFSREVYSGLDTVIPLPELEAELALSEAYEGIEVFSEPGTAD